MSDRPRTRQELYERIRQTSKDEVILEDMIRLGFWPAQGQIPQDPADEIREQGDLARQIAALRTEQARLQNVEALRRELRKRRLDESRKKQHENKLRRERERVERAAAWNERKKRELLFLGQGVSGGLSKGRSANGEKLRALGVPILENAAQIAQAMDIDVGALRFLAYARQTSQRTHYVRFQLPKKTGGTRLISAPMPRLKSAQRWILEHVLEKVAITDFAHGFAADRSIVTNARPHVGAAVVVNLDLREFFPTLTFRRIKGMFEGLGYGEEVATIFALLASAPEIEEVELDGVTYFVATGPRKLPQGSPASPAITNIICRRLDKRLAGMAKRLGFTYTRYADDLTFSCATKPEADAVGKLLRRVRWLVEQEGFATHDKKTRVLRRGRRQEVTGVVVNRKPGIPRDDLRRFRAVLFQVDKDGPTGKRWGMREGIPMLASLVGYASYIAMVDAEKGKPLLVKAREVAARHGWKPTPGGGPAAVQAASAGRPTTTAESPTKQPIQAPPAAEPPKKKWWKIL